MKLPSLPFAVMLAAIHPAWCQTETDPNAANLEALRKSATTFVEAFNKADAKAVAATFLPEGEITRADGTVVSGREAITELYQENFAGDAKPQAALEAGSVRFVAPGIAIEQGTLHVTGADEVVTSHPYTAVQVKQEDGTWLTASVKDELEDGAAPSDKLMALQWMLGDWVIQQKGTESKLSFEWSDFGPYLEGTAEVNGPDGASNSVVTRIGWDNRRKGFISWSHDSAGGFVKSDWTETAPLTWLLRTKGITADGEDNEYTQICTVDPERQGFTWIIRDQLIGGEAQPDRVLNAVKRPPTPAAAGAESK